MTGGRYVPKPDRRSVTTGQRTLIVRLYDDGKGLTIKQCAEQAGTSYGTTWRILNDEKVERRRHGGYRRGERRGTEQQ